MGSRTTIVLYRRCEVELCTHSHGEADLQRAFIMCSKNPGHEDFIPVYKFRKEHLPKGFQNSCLMELIQVLSDLTVRVSVQYTSENRPETCPHNGTPYPFYRQRDTNMVRTGTGWVWNLEKFSQMYDMKTCPCLQCRLSENPETKWAEIVIGSAAHVVFDDKEGRHTTCHLFYDKGSTPEEDKCKMIYITHDMELADRLESLTKRFVDLQKILNQMFNSKLDSVEMQSRLIVSHPHGCNKQISIGYYTERVEVKDARNLTRYVYTTPTCPGSSGAPVYVLGRWRGWWPCDHPHSGNSDVNKELNFSGVGLH
ncbi:unnamed protein product [Candidula unifasciata]|uniref:Uncharacterized protein n=1 Tax=Candidula unifasciata TaxID=100452 RepID=A0A8S4A218_9EUPU|nr:unnamed protein product [Candidula unifasciata]